jgi:hypothetical protein
MSIDNYNVAINKIPEIFFLKDNISVNININCNKYNALIDTGSTNTIFFSDIITNENLDNIVDYNFNENIKFLNNNLNIIGRIWYLNLKINNIITDSSPIITNNNNNIPFDVILGLDFLMINKIDILLSENSLKINNQKIKLNTF